MFRYIIEFLQSNRTPKVFNKAYRDGYTRQWIDNIRDYRP